MQFQTEMVISKLNVIMYTYLLKYTHAAKLSFMQSIMRCTKLNVHFGTSS